MAKLKPYNLNNIKLKLSSKVGCCIKRLANKAAQLEEIPAPLTAQKHSL